MHRKTYRTENNMGRKVVKERNARKGKRERKCKKNKKRKEKDLRSDSNTNF